MFLLDQEALVNKRRKLIVFIKKESLFEIAVTGTRIMLKHFPVILLGLVIT